jgi:hypothetical protein
MSWLVWRQHRWDAVSTAAIVVVFGGGLILLTIATASAIAAVGHACANVQQPPLLNGPCESLSTQYHDTFGKFETFFYLSALAFPVLAGVFVGAPLISREFEHGTHLLVWSQGITRRRWFVSVVGLTVVGTTLSLGLLSIMYEVWLSDHGAIRNTWYEFDARPPVLVAYTFFALTLGIALGGVIQRMLPTIAATLVIFLAIRIPVEVLGRPNFQPPLTWDVGTNRGAFDSSPLYIGTQEMIDLAGHPVGVTRWSEILNQCSATIRGDNSAAALHNCLLDHGVRVVQLYQPESRFWLFQSIEAAIFVVLAAALLVVAYKLVMRKN